MKHIQNFESFLFEALSVKTGDKNQGKRITVKFEASFGKISTKVDFFVGEDSLSAYDIYGKKNREAIEKYLGVPAQEAIDHLKKVNNDESKDALAIVQVNTAGTDNIYGWLNGTRLGQLCKENGKDKVLAENIAYVAFGLANQILAKEYLKTQNIDWLSEEGLTKWPDYTQNGKKGLLPTEDLQGLISTVASLITPLCNSFMEKYV